MTEVQIKKIKVDAGTQQRETSQALIKEYAELYNEGYTDFPPISCVWDGTHYILYDGFHRYFAQLSLGVKTISVESVLGDSDRAVLLSYGVNAKHGKPRTREEKRQTVLRALAHSAHKLLSTYEIAKACEVSQPFVASLRDKPEAKSKPAAQAAKPQEETQEQADEPAQETTQEPPQATSNNLRFGDDGENPDESEESKLDELIKMTFDQANLLLESDEPLKVAMTDLTKVTAERDAYKARMNGMMNTNNTLIDQCEKLEKTNKRLLKKNAELEAEIERLKSLTSSPF